MTTTLIDNGAVFSACRRYRYLLWRIWSEVEPIVTFIGLNPSTADESVDDPTIRRCIGFAKRWGHGGILMMNLFAFRATDPRELLRVDDPIGPDNDFHLCHQMEMCPYMVAAWGVHGSLGNRGERVRAMLGDLRHLGLTKGGHPKHPLYLRADTELQEWNRQ